MRRLSGAKKSVCWRANYVGYSCGKDHALEYRVEHPQWKCSEVERFDISVNFGETYGEDFAFLENLEPYNAFCAVGFRVTATFPNRV